jgi:hypothetical protein
MPRPSVCCGEETRLFGANTNKNGKEEKNLLGDLPWSRSKPRPIPEFDEISFYDERFSKKRFIKLLKKLKVYFYFNEVSYHKK